jgi:redox-sensitive bicupin YhaK (pirin superfamily)
MSIEIIIAPRDRDLGGFHVRRVLPFAKRRSVGPFVFFDHLGPATFAPGAGLDVRSHPHIGLATVTWLVDGALDHRDSLGSIQTIRPGAVNWMTAGRGIVHTERTPPAERAAGHSIEALQTWVALPRSHEEQAPAFHHHPAETLPKLKLPGASGVVIAGSAFGQTSPVEFPAGICQVWLEASADTVIDAPPAQELSIYVVRGSADVAGTPLEEAHMAVLGPERPVAIALKAGTRIMLAGGDALDGARTIDWNFVSSSPDRIKKAYADWRASIAGKFNGTYFTQPPRETSWIPLPGDEEPVPHDAPPYP